MKGKRIVFTRPCQTELLDYEVSEPGDKEVQVKLAVSSISSGTERANLVGSKTVAWNRPELKEAVFPRYGGYSSAGVVVKTGKAVTAVKPGDRVALSWGTHSQYVNITEDYVCPIGEIPFEDAALFHIGTFPMAAIRKCRLEIGESAIVMGMGILGLTAVSLLHAAGAVPVIAVDPSPEKRQKALSCGADYALDPFEAEFAQKAKTLTDGGAKVGIEVTGNGKGLDGILDCMARFGRVALLGCTRDSDFTIDYYRKVHGPGITLIGAHTNARPEKESSNGWWTQKDDIQALKKLTELKRIRLSSMIDEVHKPQDAPEIYDRLAKKAVFPLVQFDWREME